MIEERAERNTVSYCQKRILRQANHTNFAETAMKRGRNSSVIRALDAGRVEKVPCKLERPM